MKRNLKIPVTKVRYYQVNTKATLDYPNFCLHNSGMVQIACLYLLIVDARNGMAVLYAPRWCAFDWTVPRCQSAATQGNCAAVPALLSSASPAAAAAGEGQEQLRESEHERGQVCLNSASVGHDYEPHGKIKITLWHFQSSIASLLEHSLYSGSFDSRSASLPLAPHLLPPSLPPSHMPALVDKAGNLAFVRESLDGPIGDARNVWNAQDSLLIATPWTLLLQISQRSARSREGERERESPKLDRRLKCLLRLMQTIDRCILRTPSVRRKRPISSHQTSRRQEGLHLHDLDHDLRLARPPGGGSTTVSMAYHASEGRCRPAGLRRRAARRTGR